MRPPGTPKDRVQFLRNAIEKVRQDEAFQKEMAEAMGIRVSWVTIQETEKISQMAMEAKKNGTYKSWISCRKSIVTYMKLNRESWLLSITTAAATAAFFIFVCERFLQIQLYEGLIFEFVQ